MKARIWGSTRWIWSRHPCVAARAETSRLASLATSAEIVSWFNMTQPQPTLRPQRCRESDQAGPKRRAGNHAEHERGRLGMGWRGRRTAAGKRFGGRAEESRV